jgi:hypothetical protein
MSGCRNVIESGKIDQPNADIALPPSSFRI